MRDLTAVEIEQVSGGFNLGVIVWTYTIGFVVGAISAAPLGPGAMLVGGFVGGFEGAVVSTGEELARHGFESLRTGEDQGFTDWPS